jgi:uncharacterized cupredoxin-like copper-binding protein
MSRKLVIVAVVGVLAVWVWGALGTLGGSRGSGSGTVDIALSEMSFTPNRIDARVGQTIRLRITNDGVQRHDLAFASGHMPGLAGAETILEPGETRTLTVKFDAPGVHKFGCSLPGHAAAGMTGAIFVSP